MGMVGSEQIRRRLSNGFRPFKLRLSEGRTIPVEHPEFVAVGRGIVVVVGPGDTVNTIDALHVVSIEESRTNFPSGSLPDRFALAL
jgi:hypothetical protein